MCIRDSYESQPLVNQRARLRFEFASYHELWNSSAATATDASQLYRTRDEFQPVLSVRVARPLEVSFGASFESLGQQPVSYTHLVLFGWV